MHCVCMKKDKFINKLKPVYSFSKTDNIIKKARSNILIGLPVKFIYYYENLES